MQHVQSHKWRMLQGWGMIEKCRRGFLAIHLLWEYDKSIFIHSIEHPQDVLYFLARSCRENH